VTDSQSTAGEGYGASKQGVVQEALAELYPPNQAHGTEMGSIGCFLRTRIAVSRPFQMQPVSNAQMLCSAT